MAAPEEEPWGLGPVLSRRLAIQKIAASVLYSTIHEWQTRVLFLRPGKFGEPLVADMHVVDLLHGRGIVLNSGPQRRRIEYRALSYCWGAADFQKDIICNDTSYPITENLFDGLQHIRLQHDILVIWIDALCINQHDTAEKSLQIANILTIFFKATEVIAWLGNGNARTSHAFKMLREGGGTEDQHTQECVQEVLRNSWFRRIWVKQEVFAAQRLYLQCGEDVLPWKKIEIYLFVPFIRCNFDIKARIEKGEKPNVWLTGEWSGGSPHDTDIINILRATSNSEATDARDFVYGLLGMSRITLVPTGTREDEVVFPADYAKSVSNVFQDVARYVMKRDGCLNILLLDCNFGPTIYGDRLPSWVPDFRRLPRSSKWLIYSQVFHQGFHCYGIERFMETACPYLEPCEGGVLALRGFVLAYVGENHLEPLQQTCYKLAKNKEVDCALHDVASSIKDSEDRRTAMKGIPEDRPLALKRIRDELRADIDDRLFLHDEYRTDRLSRNSTSYLTLQGHNLPGKGRRRAEYSVVLSPDMLLFDNIQLSTGLEMDPYPKEKRPDTKYVDTFSKTDILRGLCLTLELRSRLGEALRSKSWRLVSYSEDQLWLLEQSPEQWKPKAWVVPDTAREGDAIMFPLGGLSPIVVRPIPGTTKYQFIGPAATTRKSEALDGKISEGSRGMARYAELQYLVWLGFLEIHEEDNRLETFHLV